MRRIGWNGPAPPRGHGVRRYRSSLYALTRPVDLALGYRADVAAFGLRPTGMAFGNTVRTLWPALLGLAAMAVLLLLASGDGRQATGTRWQEGTGPAQKPSIASEEADGSRDD